MRLPLIALLLMLPMGAWAQKLSPLAPPPDWSRLDPYQETISQDAFVQLLDRLYAPGGAWKKTIRVTPEAAFITERYGQPAAYELRFASPEKKTPRFWRKLEEIPGRTAALPLNGVKITLDPGHLGGEWAKIEERWMQLDGGRPVMEGEISMEIALMVKQRLEALGALVTFTRKSGQPATTLRPRDLEQAARDYLIDDRHIANPAYGYKDLYDPARVNTVKWRSEWLFYRPVEIRARSELVNQSFQPDLVLCLHLNAEDWGDPRNPRLVDKSHLHFLVTGAAASGEMDYDDERFEILLKLLSRGSATEVALAESVAQSMAAATRLPAYAYHGDNAIPAGSSGYVWARNLLANRMFLCPTVYVEAYVMNNKTDYARLQLGPYEGTRLIDGRPRVNLWREYADSLVEGLKNYALKSIP
jgi:hypothetical protein